MNILSFSGTYKRLRHKIMFRTRLLEVGSRTESFSLDSNSSKIQRIYVINLDRKPDRWRQVSRELKRIRSYSGTSLNAITRRFSAIDARYLDKTIDSSVLRTHYTLSDQLTVEPNPLVSEDDATKKHRIDMSPQEVAVALSHIEVWKLIAENEVPYTLVLEDDAYFRRGFSKSLDAMWKDIINEKKGKSTFDLLYLSFQEVGINLQKKKLRSKLAKKPSSGIWQASGYVLSHSGAEKLIELLPVFGPIDLWLNLQFGKLDVLLAPRPIIEQRVDVPSTNSYSVMPVLAQIGVHTKEKPLVIKKRKLPGPIFAYGESKSGLTSLALALSMLGYTCCSDIDVLPLGEFDNLINNKKERYFNAYVNIGLLNSQTLEDLLEVYPDALIISTNQDDSKPLISNRNKFLHLPIECVDKWAALSTFIGCEYPAFPYPTSKDIGQRSVETAINDKLLHSKNLKFDVSPWILPSDKWRGIHVSAPQRRYKTVAEWTCGDGINKKIWKFRNDTFPSNLAIFNPENIVINESNSLRLELRDQSSTVRAFTSGAVVTQQSFMYGKFSADICPSNVSGLITGLFLHRNGPHQEIDIEFLGKDTTKMLVNVFYNPGIAGTKLEYGYRGTPTIIDLGFDAADDFHRYEIEWYPNSIRWSVDGNTVYQRKLWNPTPIPNLPMEFNINLWHTRSKELAGSLGNSNLPACTDIKAIKISQ